MDVKLVEQLLREIASKACANNMQAINSVEIAYVRSTSGAFTWQITDMNSEKRNTISIESTGVAVGIAALVAHLKARNKVEFNGPSRPSQASSTVHLRFFRYQCIPNPDIAYR